MCDPHSHLIPSIHPLLIVQIAIWGSEYKIAGVKSRRGEPMNERITAGSLITTASHNRRHERGLYSLAIALLPFFTPERSIREKLEDPKCMARGTDQNQYLQLLQTQPIFAVLAYFCI